MLWNSAHATVLVTTVSLECDRITDETQIVVGDSGTSSVLVFPVTGESAGEAFRRPFR